MNSPSFIDTHAHLFTEEFETDLSDVIGRAREAGVTKVFMPNIDASSLDSLLRVCRTYSGYCFPMLGLHPTSVTEDYQEELAHLKQYLRPPHPFVAIGEVGLDFYWDKSHAVAQQQALDEQIRWAIEEQLPLVIHCREAFGELYDSLMPYRSQGIRGIFHCFTGSEEEAERFLSLDGFLFGVNGSATYKKSRLPAMLKARIPLSRLVLETDAPYLAPTSHRGQRNETAYLPEVARLLADTYEVSVDEVGRITSENANRLFGERRIGVQGD